MSVVLLDDLDGLVLRPQVEGMWRVETLTCLQDIRNKTTEWLAFERDAIDPFAAFQSYGWCESWATNIAALSNGKLTPRIFFIYRGETLMVILPMMVRTSGGVRLLTTFADPHTQIGNAIFRPNSNCADGVRLCIAEAEVRCDVDVINFGPLPENCDLVSMLDDSWLEPDASDFMSIATWEGIWRSEDYEQHLSRRRRHDLKKKVKAIEAEGSVRFSRFGPESELFKPLVKQALKWKREWLAANGKASFALSADGVDAFLTDFSLREGGFEPQVEALSIDGKPVALAITLYGRGVHHGYLSSYDPSYAHVSPGALIHQYAIKSAIDDGDSAYNFMGHPSYFKSLWSNQKMPLLRYSQPLTPKGKLWLKLWFRLLRPAAKTILIKSGNLKNLPVLGPASKRMFSWLSRNRATG